MLDLPLPITRLMNRLQSIITTTKQTLVTILLLLYGSAMASGCALMLAAGAGAGAYSYISGNVIRTYEAEYDPAVRASLKVMSQLDFKLRQETGDALKTVISGKRADDTPVTIEVERIEADLTRIGVRTGVVGVNDVTASEQVHEYIARQLIRPSPSGQKAASAQQKEIKDQAAKEEEPSQITPTFSSTKKIQQSSPQPSASEEVPAAADNKKLYASLPHNSLYIYYSKSDLDIPDSSYETLNRVADYLMRKPTTTIEIRGYTDSSGDPATNLSLSQKKARAIRDYLIGKGISSERITAEGFGASNFLESNRTEKLRAMNRRVELHIN